MKDEDEHLERLSRDLGAVYGPAPRAPAGLDQQILSRARAEMLRRRRFRALRWVGAAAAAACLVIVMRVTLISERAPVKPVAIHAPAGQSQVTILDALRLAQQIERGAGRDVNHDGMIDRGDVDALALAAVRIDRQPVH